MCELASVVASVVTGVHENVQDAVKEMVRESRRVTPNVDAAEKYEKIYNEVYTKLSPSVQPLVHSIASLRGGNIKHSDRQETEITVSPSLLACDWSNIESEIRRCVDANLKRLHIDVFDGVFLNSPDAFTFGPQMVRAMRSVSDDIILDIHLCVDRPMRFVESMSKAGASRIIFQWEAMLDLKHAKDFAQDIMNHSMNCGISINPETDVSEILPLLETGLCDTVNVLGVNPGFGGQKLQERSLEKLATIRSWIDKNEINNINLIIDGGVNDKTADSVKLAGANVLVAGSYLFNCDDIEEGSKILSNYSS